MHHAATPSHRPPLRLASGPPPVGGSGSGRWATPAGAQIVSIERRQWTRAEAVVRSLRCDQPLTLDLRAERHQLIVILEQVGGHLDIGPDREAERQNRSPERPIVRGPHFSVIPAGSPAWASSGKVGFVRGMTLLFDADIVEQNVDLERAFAPRMMHTDARLLGLATLIAEECASAKPRDRVFEDSLSLALLSCLAHLPPPLRGISNRGGLAPWQLKKVHDFLHSHIDGSLRLDQLAQITQLSLSHFCRSFKTTTGLAPHQWILQARINKARELLLEPRARLADVAAETGFSDQAHFTRTFGRVVGQSPGAWQRSRCA